MEFSERELIIFSAGGLILLIQLWHHLIYFGKLAFYKPAERTPVNEPVSVVICARNEYENLKKNLPFVLHQKYDNYQVVVVNDCSWDESKNLLEEYQKHYPHLKVVTINEQEKYRHGKKFALSLGIKAAAHEILLLTDADCRPVTEHWIDNMVRGYTSGKDIVVGYGAYVKSPGFFNKWVRLDTVFNAVQYLSAALRNKAYMGVGRNLSYKKTLFFKNKGFASHNHIMSGDDDLFVNETASSKNVSVELHPAAFTVSETRRTFKGWLKQKKRHMSTGRHYRTKDKLRIGTYFMTHFLFYITLAVMLIAGIDPLIIAGAFAFRLLVQLLIFGSCMKKLGELDVLWLWPLFDFLVIFIYPILTISNLLFKDKTWR